MKRTPIKRSTKPIKRKPRSKSEFARIYGPPGYVEWIHRQKCCACLVWGYSECAHLRTGGLGRKDDWTRTIPLCRNPYGLTGCHTRLHAKGRQAFEAEWGINLAAYAEATQSRWLAFSKDST